MDRAGPSPGPDFAVEDPASSWCPAVAKPGGFRSLNPCFLRLALSPLSLLLNLGGS